MRKVGGETPFQNRFFCWIAPWGYFLCGRKGVRFQKPFLLSRPKKWFLESKEKALGTMLMVPAPISGAEGIRIVSASVPAQPLTLALVELLCVFVVAPAWVLPIRRWRAEGGALPSEGPLRPRRVVETHRVLLTDA